MKKILCSALFGITTCFGASSSSQIDIEQKATICLVKLQYQARYVKELPFLGLQDTGSGVSLPTISIGTGNTKTAVLNWVQEHGASIDKTNIHPFMHIESVTPGQKLIDDYFLVVVDAAFIHPTIEFAVAGDSAHFYPQFKQEEANLLKPVLDFKRSFCVQKLISNGYDGSAETPYCTNEDSFNTLIKSYPGCATGRLTIPPELFQIYGEKRVQKEVRNHSICTVS